MKIIKEPLEGLKLIQLDVYKDNRGFFCERYSESKFKNIGLPAHYVQDNFSHSQANVVRGLHYQKNPDQAKYVMCLHGKIIDIAVDIRKNSKTFGKHFAVELTPDNGLALFIPAGFAHGFACIEASDVLYKVDGVYNRQGEGGIIYNDKELALDWGIKGVVIVSDKDLVMQSFAEYKNNPAF